MKVIHICLNCFYVDNMEYQENVLPRKHKEMGYEVFIISSVYAFNPQGVYSRPTGRYVNNDGVNVIILPYTLNFKGSRALGLYKSLYKEICELKPDIIFIHGLMFMSVSSIIKYKKNNPKVLIFGDSHQDENNTQTKGIIWKSYMYFWKMYIKNKLPFIEVIWGVLPIRVNFLKKFYGIPENKTAYLPMGGDENKIDFENRVLIRQSIRQKYKIKESDFLIVSGGKIDKRKNIPLLLTAVNNLSEEISGIKIIIFGTPNKEMQDEIEQFTKTNQVIFVGWQDTISIYNIFLSSDLVVFPGTHSVMWEQAVACGVPTVFKYWEGMQHVDLGGNCKFLYHDSIEEIGGMLRDIICDKDLYSEMMNASLEKGPIYFSYKEIANKAITPLE